MKTTTTLKILAVALYALMVVIILVHSDAPVLTNLKLIGFITVKMLVIVKLIQVLARHWREFDWKSEKKKLTKFRNRNRNCDQ